MGADLGLNATMFGLATTLFYATYVISAFQQHYAEHCWRAALDCHHYGAVGHRLHCHHVRHRAEKLYVLRMLVGITEAGFLPGILLYLTYCSRRFSAPAPTPCL